MNVTTKITKYVKTRIDPASGEIIYQKTNVGEGSEDTTANAREKAEGESEAIK